MRILAVDPGTTKTAWLVWDTDGGRILDFGHEANEEFLERVERQDVGAPRKLMALEMVAHYGTGMPAGAEIFETVFWAGRFAQAWQPEEFRLVYRKEVKIHLCQSMRAKDANIRQALIDRLGAPGTKRSPGPTYRVAGDVWAALAIAVTVADSMAPDEIGARPHGVTAIQRSGPDGYQDTSD